jgi:hypothetical protein
MPDRAFAYGGVARALLAVLVKSGMASAAEVGIDTLVERLRQVFGRQGPG